jgi:hypothetical protein
MNSRLLLIGIGASLALAGAARADCGAYGPGYVSAPGSNVCIKIGGSVQAGVSLQNLKGLDASGGGSGDGFQTQADVNVTTKSTTDWGALTTYTDLRSRRVQ